MKTASTLPDAIHQLAKEKKTRVPKFIRGLLDKALARQEQRQIQRTYEVLKEMRGMGEEGDAEASASIDELLYGEEGAWRGESTSRRSDSHTFVSKSIISDGCHKQSVKQSSHISATTCFRFLT
jgi:hypothetical protein